MSNRLKGIGAAVALLAFVLAVPAALLTLGHDHVPTSVPTWQQVRTAIIQPDNGTLLLGALVIAGWLAWLTFTGCLLLEIGARVRAGSWTRTRADGTLAPTLRGLHWQQRAAGTLITAIALLFLAAPAMAPAMASAATPTAHTAGTTASATHIPGPRTTSSAASARPAPVHDDAAAARPAAGRTVMKDHTVRHGETLWSIAEQYYGRGYGSHYKAIAEANYGHDQPDGGRLTNDHWIRTGWVLQVPVHVTTADVTPTPHVGQTRTHQTQTHHTQTHHTAAPRPHVGPKPPVPAPVQPVPQQPTTPTSTSSSTSTTSSTPAAATSQTHHDSDEILTVRTPMGIGAILAVGVISLVGAGRTVQRRRRRPGTSIPMPAGDSAAFEQQLRATADPISVELVDHALRALHKHCTNTHHPLPIVRAARLTAEQFDLYLAEPAQLPEPWTGMGDQLVWTIDGADAATIDATGVGDVPAPYPSLVTVGHDDEDGHVLLDLEYLGALGVTGAHPGQAREVLAAIAIELATSTWADDLLVTIVGAYSELEDILHTGRVRYAPTAGHVIDELATRARHDRDGLAKAGGDLNHARPAGAEPDLWTPEIVLVAGDITADQRARLTAVVEDAPRVAIAAVTADTAISEWVISLSGDDDTAILRPLGLHLRPQRVDTASYNQLLELAATAGADPIDDNEQWDAPALPAPSDLPPAVDEPDLEDHLDSELPDALAGFVTVPARRGGAADIPPIRQVDPVDGDAETKADLAGTEQLTVPATADTAISTPEDEAWTWPDDGDDDSADLSLILPNRAPTIPDSDSTPSGEPQDVHRQGDDVTAGEHEPTEQVAPAPNDDLDQTAKEPEQVSARTDAADEPLAVDNNGEPHRPRLRLLGPVALIGAHGVVEPSKRARLTELAAYLALNPGANQHSLDAALWPGVRGNTNNRNTSISKLRRWLSADDDGEQYMPRYSADNGYTLGRVYSDWAEWKHLVPGLASDTATEHLEQALQLVTGRPFEGTPSRRYSWAEPVHEQMIEAVTDAAYELARRMLMEGRWRAAERAAVIGINVDLTREALWRARILAAHSSGNTAAEKEAIDRMVTAMDGGGFDLEPETEQLLEQLENARKAGAR